MIPPLTYVGLLRVDRSAVKSKYPRNLKSKVYKRNPVTISALNENIVGEINVIPASLF